MVKASRDHIDNHDNVDAANESTRLLPDGEDEEAVSSRTPNPNNKPTPTPLPKAQLGALIAVRIVDPIAYQQIFPYINQLLADLRIAEPDQVGFYSGDITMGEDMVGRRPVVFTGLVGIAVTTAALGLSTSFAGIVASRFFGGLVAGNVAVIHSILAEITDDTNQDLAVPIYSLSWPVGTVIGPLIGGTLANAATRYPQFFSWHIFSEHPYLPPCVVSAACALVGAGMGYTLIEETLPSKRKDAHASTRASSVSRSHTGAELDETEPASVMALLSIPAIRALTISGFALSSLSLAFDVVFALFCYSPVDAGGLGLEPSTIGNMLAFAGTLAVLLRFFAMPYILRRFNYAKTYNACMYIWPVAFGLLPFLNIFARSASALVWMGLLTLLALSKVGAIPHSLSMLLIKRHAPSPSALGRSNGLVQFAMSERDRMGETVGSGMALGSGDG
ncbi:major facilitator superfamily domain-containing protein [Lanmaoa asiatica]|nr:major facilitator superfamily domain-containing protein [Lanmaoa asiatica]